MAARSNIAGQRFGRLVALSREPVSNQRSRWLFQCDCGAQKSIRTSHVLSGSVNSCGCLVRTRGGRSGSRIMHIWRGMMSRCHKPHDERWKWYGGRGIQVCEAWRDFDDFREWAEGHGYADTLEIDRIDNDDGYHPANCRFVTRTQNVRNRRVTRMIEREGHLIPLATAAEQVGIPYSTLKGRLDRGDTGASILRSTSLRTFFGEPMTLKSAEARFGIKERTIRYRLKRGLTPDEAVSRPLDRSRAYEFLPK